MLKYIVQIMQKYVVPSDYRVIVCFPQKKGVELMQKVAECSSKRARHLKFAAHYNMGRAYYQGCGVKQSDAQAEK